MKIKWQVSPVATGPYKSFQHRNWPTAYICDKAGDKIIASIGCIDDYNLKRAKAGNHSPLTVRIAKWNLTEEEKKKFGAFIWLKFKKQTLKLEEAKKMVEEFLKENPKYTEFTQ